MKKNHRYYTPEQLEWRDAILKKKKVQRIEVPLINSISNPNTTEEKIFDCFYYMNNCVFWINEFLNRRADRKKLLSVSKSLQALAADLEKILTH